MAKSLAMGSFFMVAALEEPDCNLFPVIDVANWKRIS